MSRWSPEQRTDGRTDGELVVFAWMSDTEHMTADSDSLGKVILTKNKTIPFDAAQMKSTKGERKTRLSFHKAKQEVEVGKRVYYRLLRTARAPARPHVFKPQQQRRLNFSCACLCVA